MAEMIVLLLALLGGGTAVAALLITLSYLLPGRSRSAAQAMDTTTGRTFLIGLVNLIFFGVLAALLFQGGEFLQLLGLLLLLGLLAVTLVGWSGLLLLLQGRVYPLSQGDGENTPGDRVKTAVLLVLGALAPVAGWFIFLPLATMLGLGAGLRALVRRKRNRPAYLSADDADFRR